MLDYIQILPGCPYYGLETSIDLTCEEGLCSWLRQPSNVYSSFVFFIPAIYILWHALKNKTINLRIIGFIGIFIGLSSVMAHATHLKVFGFADFTFQFLLILVLIWLNFQRTSKKIPIPLWYFSLSTWLVSAVLQWFFTLWSLMIYGVLLALVLGSELYAFLETRKGQYRDYKMCALFLSTGIIAFYLDAFGIVCDPNDHVFQLHALWHILSAISIYFLYRHYLQFYKL